MSILNNKLEIHFDYLSFTFPLDEEGKNAAEQFEELKNELAEVLYYKPDQYGELRNWAQDNYSYQISIGEFGIIRFGGFSTMMKSILDLDTNLKSIDKFESCNVELKGQALREIEFLSENNCDYIKIFEYFLVKRKGKCKRCDIAIDDMTGDIVHLEDVYKMIVKGHYTSSFRGFPELDAKIISGDDVAENEKGMSLYFGKSNGKRKNNLELCIYNKAAERKFKNDSWLGDYWTRYEIRYRHEKAEQLTYHLLKYQMNDIGELAMNQLKDILTLKQKTKDNIKTNDSNVSRWDIWHKWDLFLNTINNTKLSLRPKKDMTIERKVSWRSFSLTKQNILMELSEAFIYNQDWLDPSFAETYVKLCEQYDYLMMNDISKQEIEMINNYRRVKKLPLINENDIKLYCDELLNRIKYFEEKLQLPY